MSRRITTLLAALALLVTGCDPSKLSTLVQKPTTGTGASLAMAGTVSGVILSPEGKPAAGVQVTSYLATVAPLTTVAPYRSGKRRVQASDTVTTDDQGVFHLLVSGEGTYNVEGVVPNADLKVFKSSVTLTKDQGADVGNLTLQPTGTIRGKVAVPVGSTVTNLSAVSIVIPGSSYAASADASGSFTMTNVAMGNYSLLAYKTGTALGTATAPNVAVQPRQVTEVPPMVLTVRTPEIATLSTDIVGPGAELTIKGSNFGASTGEVIHVYFGDTILDPQVVDDSTLKIKVPSKAVSDDVVVSVGGILSKGVHCTVLQSFDFYNVRTGFDTVWIKNGEEVDLRAYGKNTENEDIADVPLTFDATGSTIALVRLGVFRGVHNGITELWAHNGDLGYNLLMHVWQVFGVSLNQTSHILHPPGSTAGDTSLQLTATVDQSDGAAGAANYPVNWASSDTSRATVDDTGLVQAVTGAASGTVEITATSVDDDHFSATCSIAIDTP